MNIAGERALPRPSCQSFRSEPLSPPPRPFALTSRAAYASTPRPFGPRARCAWGGVVRRVQIWRGFLGDCKLRKVLVR